MPRYYFLEHLARYAFIRDRIQGSSRVLDVGCGIGYGTHFICQETFGLIGIDISLDAIRQAQHGYSHPLISFLVAQGEALPFRGQTFDTVISFEVIEHLSPENQASYLYEISRVLKVHGQCFLSTPNRKFTAGRANPYHLREFYSDELHELLSCYFPRVELYGQCCDTPAARIYTGKAATAARKLKERLRIQFLLPHWMKRALELFFTGSTMASAELEDYKFLARDIDNCHNVLAICYRAP